MRGVPDARRSRGFTLTELAVVFAIVALLLAAGLFTLSAQTEVRNFEETRRRLDMARELLLSYAIVNGRLPCPARSAGTAAPVTVAGEEVRDANGACVGDTVTDNYGGTSGGVTLGLLPARAIGFQIADANGFAVDAYGNRIRYAVERFVTGTGCAGTLPHFTRADILRANGIECQPRDLLLCRSATGVVGTPAATSCGSAANTLTNQNIVVAVVYSVGKNFSSVGAGGIDEVANLNGDAVFVWHTPTPAGATNGEFDDQMTWITVGELYSKLIAANLLP